MSCYNNIPCLLHGSWLSNVQSVAPQLESHATENIMCRGFAAICMSSQRSASTPYTSQPVECKCHKVTLCRCQNQPAIGAIAACKTRPALTPFHLLALYHSMHSFSPLTLSMAVSVGADNDALYKSITSCLVVGNQRQSSSSSLNISIFAFVVFASALAHTMQLPLVLVSIDWLPMCVFCLPLLIFPSHTHTAHLYNIIASNQD